MKKRQLRVCVVGAGTRFMSGISYYTLRLINAFAQSHRTSAILMRQLLPTRLYPGRERVGQSLTKLAYHPDADVFDGVDWYWLPSLLPALLTIWKNRPDVVVLQWWTGTVFHSYLPLVILARLLGAKVVIEFHEVLDTAEARMPVARAYVGTIAPLLVRLSSAFVIHSSFDLPALKERYPLGDRPVAIIPHGPFDHYQLADGQQPQRSAPADCCNLLFFGVIRPYKGLEDLVAAFEAIPEDMIERFWLTVVGEPWEDWTLPLEMIEKSRYRDRITFIKRYVPDEEVAAYFAGADAVVLPYHRSSASGPVHVTMSQGLPLVVTQVGGLTEAVADYEGAIMVPPKSPEELRDALLQVLEMRGKRYEDPHSWEHTAERFTKLFESLGISTDTDLVEGGVRV
jgi:glycosyltransferase involved in cell wall biosynthesis